MQEFFNSYHTLYATSCNCPPQCNQTMFEHTYSANTVSNFAAETITTELLLNETCVDVNGTEVCTLDGDFNSTVDYLKDNIVDLNIYYGDLTLQTVQERAAYSILSLLCDIGGAMGLVLGSTVLTVAEVSEFWLGVAYDTVLFKLSQMRRFHRVKAEV